MFSSKRVAFSAARPRVEANEKAEAEKILQIKSVARVRRRGDRPPSRKNRNIYSWQMCGDKEFLSLHVKYGLRVAT